MACPSARRKMQREKEKSFHTPVAIDQYAPLTYVRPDAPPFIIISGDRKKELYGRYEEQAYFWRMLKLTGHPDVTIYEMQGYDHGAMPHPAYHILKEHIKRLTGRKKR